MTSIPTRKIEMKTAIELAAALSARYLDTKQMLPDELAHEAAAMIRQQAEQIETERMRLVACGVVAMADTPGSAKLARIMHADYRSASFDDVIRRVDECMALRVERDALKADAERYRIVLSLAYVGIAPHPKPHEVWCLRLPNPTGCTTLDAAIDAMKGKS